jgi:glycosyltransferase involved in cell wall biosynthesis
MNKPLISVVTINLNNRAGLQRTLRSLENQTWCDFESIIIDGGSTDGSTDLIREFLMRKKLNISYWVSERDRGLYHAQNKGIKLARGRYLLFLNSGDHLYSPHTLGKLQPEAWTKDLVYGNIILKRGWRSFKSDMPNLITIEHLYYSTLMHPATFIRRDLFRKVGYYREDFKICSDYYFFVKAILRNKTSLEYRPDVISVFYANGVSSDPRFKDIQARERLQTLRELLPATMLVQVIELQQKKYSELERRVNGLRFAIFALPRYVYRFYRYGGLW